MDGNGHESEELLESTEGNPLLSNSIFGRAFSSPNMPNALSLLVKPGKDVRDLLMRSFIPVDLTKVDFAWLAGFTSCLAQARAFKDEEWESELQDLLAGMVSLGGLGRSQMVEAVIGGYRHHNVENGQADFWETLKKKAGFGDKKGIELEK